MTNKNRKKNNAPNGAKKKKQTPFADAGAIVGSRLGQYFGAPYLKGVGKWLGSGFGQVFGSGDYTVVGERPSYNVLMNDQIPKFSTTSATNIVCHREYLGDIAGTALFNNNVYPLNPGMAVTFPWLSTVAQNYQQYKFHGILFEFRPLITDFVTGGTPGVVVMATNYNADETNYTTKQEMENSEYATSVKPTLQLLHGVECATNQTVLSQMYVRSGAPPAGVDLKFSDLGKFQIATQGNAGTAAQGELWVTYCVELFKPRLANDVGGNVLSWKAFRTGCDPANPFGTATVFAAGDLSVAFVSNAQITASGLQPGNYYLLTVTWKGSVAAAATYPAFVLVNMAQVQYFGGDLLTTTTSPTAGSPVLSMTTQTVLRFTGTGGADQGLIGLGLAGLYPTGVTGVDIVLSQISSESL